jgi:hypothetical protein
MYFKGEKIIFSRRKAKISLKWFIDLNMEVREIPRWWLEVGSRKRRSYSEILERRWRHTLQA